MRGLGTRQRVQGRHHRGPRRGHGRGRAEHEGKRGSLQCPVRGRPGRGLPEGPRVPHPRPDQSLLRRAPGSVGHQHHRRFGCELRQRRGEYRR